MSERIDNGIQRMMVLLAEYTIPDANKIVKAVNEKLSKMASAAQAPPTTDSWVKSAPKKTSGKPGRR